MNAPIATHERPAAGVVGEVRTVAIRQRPIARRIRVRTREILADGVVAAPKFPTALAPGTAPARGPPSFMTPIDAV
jgi:hypothetical protein